MFEGVKFLTDPDSPAMGRLVQDVRLTRMDLLGRQTSPMLVKKRRVAPMVIESGSVPGLPGVRVSQLWRAQSSDGIRPLLTLREAKETCEADGYPPIPFLISAKVTGELAVSSCLGHFNNTPEVQIPDDTYWCTVDRPVIPVALHDFAGSLYNTGPLLDMHMLRAESEKFDPGKPLTATEDSQWMTVLQQLPVAKM